MNSPTNFETPHYQDTYRKQNLLVKNISLLNRHKKLFILVAATVGLTYGTIALLTYKPSYVAEGMVVIKDSAVTAKYVTGDNYETTASQSTNSVINIMGLLKADGYMQKIYDYLLSTHPEELKKHRVKNIKDWEDFFEDGGKFFKYANIPGTDMINMSFKWQDPVIAKEGLEAMIDEFRQKSLRLNKSEQHERHHYLTDQIRDIQDKLIGTRKRISEFKAANHIINTAEENANLSRARMELKANLEATVAAAHGKNSEINSYQNLLGMNAKQAVTAAAIGRNQSLSNLYQELYRMRAEKNALLTRYTDESPKVRDLNEKLDQTQVNIKKELRRTVGKVNMDVDTAGSMAFSDSTRSGAVSELISAKASATELAARSNSLNHSLGELESRAKKLTLAESTLANYVLEEETLNESLKILKQKEIDANLKEQQTLSNIFLIEPTPHDCPKLVVGPG
jgi:uncharacterized protein involved in exopolysaccharide biosynthesis